MNTAISSKQDRVGMALLASAAGLGFHYLKGAHSWKGLALQVGMGAGVGFCHYRDQAGEPSRLTQYSLALLGGSLIGQALFSTRLHLANGLRALSNRSFLDGGQALTHLGFHLGTFGLLGVNSLRYGFAASHGAGWAKERHARLKMEDTSNKVYLKGVSLYLAYFTDDERGKELVLNSISQDFVFWGFPQYKKDWMIKSLTRYWPDLSEEEQARVVQSTAGWGLNRDDLEKALVQAGLCLESPLRLFGGVDRADPAYATLLKILEIEDTPKALNERIQERLGLLGLPMTFGPGVTHDTIIEGVENYVRKYLAKNKLEALPLYQPSKAFEREELRRSDVEPLFDHLFHHHSLDNRVLRSLGLALGLIAVTGSVLPLIESVLAYPTFFTWGVVVGVTAGGYGLTKLDRGLSRVEEGVSQVVERKQNVEWLLMSAATRVYFAIFPRDEQLYMTDLPSVKKGVVLNLFLGGAALLLNHRTPFSSAVVSFNGFFYGAHIVGIFSHKKRALKGSAIKEVRAIIRKSGGVTEMLRSMPNYQILWALFKG